MRGSPILGPEHERERLVLRGQRAQMAAPPRGGAVSSRQWRGANSGANGGLAGRC
jgi:hypothetical protein